ncbi:MAG: hypothetical protein Q8N18_18885 [Opitutaceae bacterium]|nr:hypothetical protein [Opitutaceae bacterium]
MGKPFSTELTRLPSTLRWAEDTDILAFSQFVAKAHGHMLAIIGAGGSFTVAEFARMLHEARGNAAVAHTPLSFLQSDSDLRQSFVLIFTASGGNRDILATYDAAVEREPRGILVVCGRKNSKVERRAATDERSEVFSSAFPAGKDGYLATNSLLSFMMLTLRAFNPTATALGQSTVGVESPSDLNDSWLGERPVPAHYLALFGGWARPAATDLESKLSEAGLGSVMLADYRNFAHGRHNWIHKRGEQTVVIAFLTPESEPLARRTLALLPASVRVLRLTTQSEGAAGTLELLLQVFRVTEAIGKKVGIDPGRPGVPGYGRRIYHLGPVVLPSQHADTAIEASVARKLAARNSSIRSEDRESVMAARANYVTALRQQRFGAFVADFDGTVVHPGASSTTKLLPTVAALLEKLLRARIPVYFATGRGNSIHGVLTGTLGKKYHPLVFVSYYNGSVTLPLTETPPSDTGGPHHEVFEALLRELKSDPVFARRVHPVNKSYQLTLKIKDQADFPLAAARIRETVLASFAEQLRVVESSHSLDVISRATSKLECVRLAQSQLVDAVPFTIGDRGALLGNDYDLLTHPYSLSVDAVSASLTSCWNLLPPGVRNVAGLVHVGKSLVVRRGYFTMKAP